jgi:transposase
LAGWLKAHPTIEAVVRDRSSEYGRGATWGAPEAVQAAHRWHLLYNLRQMLGRWLAGIHGRLQALPALPAQGPPTRRTRAYPRTQAEVAATAASRARWLARYEEVRRRFQAGEKLLAISRVMGLARSTVRRFAYAERFPERAVRVPPPSILDPYLGHLEARLIAGCENATALWRELQTLGFRGSSKQVHRWVSQRRTAPAKNTARSRRTAPASAPSAAAPLPSPRQLAWLMVQAPDKLEQSEAAILARIAQDAEVGRGVDLAQRLAELVRRCGVGCDQPIGDPAPVLASWLKEACACGIGPLQTFATGLQQDEGAVSAALTLPYSSGQAEGQIHKLKLIKRQMYGRANFDLLRHRVLLAA